jgi:hypothetical protein
MVAHKIKKALLKIILFAFFLSFPFCTHASGFAVHLYFNTTSKLLTFDKQAGAPVTLDDAIQIDPVTFTDNQTTGSYVLKLYDVNNAEIVSTEFNKHDGAFTVQIPYFSPANSMKILEKSSGKELLNADLSQYNACNGNGVCEFEKGENINTCLEDCGTSNVTYSDQTKSLLQQNNGVIKDPKTGKALLQDKSFSANPANNSQSSPNPASQGSSNFSSPSQSSTGQSQPASATATSSQGSSTNSIIILIIAALILLSAVGFIVYKRFIKK